MASSTYFIGNGYNTKKKMKWLTPSNDKCQPYKKKGRTIRNQMLRSKEQNNKNKNKYKLSKKKKKLITKHED